MFEWTTEERDDARVLRLAGPLTVGRARELKEALLECLLAAECTQIDLAMVTEVDMTCLQLFCAAVLTSVQLGRLIKLGDAPSDAFEKTVRHARYSCSGGCYHGTEARCLLNRGGSHG